MSKRQTVFFTSGDPMNKEHKDPDEIGLNAPRLAWHKQKVWKKHQNTVYWVDIKLESGEIIYEKVYASPRLPPKISFKDSWMKELGSEIAGGGKDSQQTQPKTKNPIVRPGRPVLSEQQSGSSVQKIENVSNLAAKAPM